MHELPVFTHFYLFFAGISHKSAWLLNVDHVFLVMHHFAFYFT